MRTTSAHDTCSARSLDTPAVVVNRFANHRKARHDKACAEHITTAGNDQPMRGRLAFLSIRISG
jgi:hypothetical protein